MKKELTIAIAGNPNSGKTSLFNSMTGSRQHVGNYPGVTVEKKEGRCKFNDLNINVVDLPGTYSLSANSIDEVVARNYLIEEKPDVVIDVVDATNLERNLYLTLELKELGVPLLLALNMSDSAKSQGLEFDLELLSKLIGLPIIPTVGNKGRGVKDVLNEVISIASGSSSSHKVNVHYGEDIDSEIKGIEMRLDESKEIKNGYNSRWLAIKLLENDKYFKENISSDVLNYVEKSNKKIQKLFGDNTNVVLAEHRYGFISGVCQEAIINTPDLRHGFSDMLDMLLINRILGIPIFLGLMYMVFQLVFSIGDIPMTIIENFLGWLGGEIILFWPRGSESALKSLIVDGIIGGVGGVVVFLPNILLLFLAIAFLEDSGYMSRAAFIMDRIMHKIGLHGRSFVAMLIGFGCSIPAIMGTRILENRTDRLTTMMIIPLMSCGARLPIYALIIPAFYSKEMAGTILMCIYLIGIILAVILAKVFRSTIFKGESTPFAMELPPYRMPTLRGLIIHMWERSKLYLKKAGTIILGISIVMWFLTSYPKPEKFDLDYEALLNVAQEQYFTEVKKVFLNIKGDAESILIVRALNAENEMENTQKLFYRSEKGFLEAAKKKEEIMKNIENSKGGKNVIEFIKMRDRVREILSNFSRTVREMDVEEGSVEYRSLENEKLHDFDRIKESNPVVYRKIIRYLEIDEKYNKTISDYERKREGDNLAFSIAGRLGHFVEGAIKPMGFDWKIGTAFIGAFAAKEVFISQLGIVYKVGEADEESVPLRNILRENYTPLIAFCIMLFALISSPCMATIAITRRESGSWKWAIFQFVFLTLLGYLITMAVYQIGSLII